MISNLDIFLDAGCSGILPGGSLAGGDLPELTRNDVYNVRLLIQERSPYYQRVDSDMSGGSFKLAMGTIDESPISGQFKLLINGVTSPAITFSSNPSLLAQSIYNATSNNVSTVNQFGVEASAFVCVASNTNSALSIGADIFSLYPSSSIFVGSRINAATFVNEQKIIKFRRNPAVYADNFVDVIEGTKLDLTKVQDGDDFVNEMYQIDVGTAVIGGSFVFNYGAYTSSAIPIFSSATVVQQSLNSITGFTGNISVNSTNNGGYVITFLNSLGQQNIVTPLTVDTTNVYYRKYKQCVVTLSTVELDELFSLQESDSVSTKIEVQYMDAGNPKTLFQGDVIIKKDLILDGTSLPVNTASYYTKAQADSLFVKDSTSGAAGTINATNFSLNSSDGKKTLDWNQRKLMDGSIEYVRWGNGIGFFGTTAVSKQGGTNLINSLTKTGLISYTPPAGSNLVNSITQTGLIQYTPPSGSNFVNSLTVSGIINYTVPSTSNIASGLNATGILNYIAPTGSNLINSLTQTGLISYTVPTGTFLTQLTKSGVITGYTVPTGSNFINALTQTGLFTYTPVTPRNSIINCLADFGSVAVSSAYFTKYALANEPTALNQNIFGAGNIGIFPSSIGSSSVSFNLNVVSAFTPFGIINSSVVTPFSYAQIIIPLFLGISGAETQVVTFPGINNIGGSLNFNDVLQIYSNPNIPGLEFRVNVATYRYISQVVTRSDGIDYFYSDARGVQLTLANITANPITIPQMMDFKLLHIAF
jgi:hypothetical protein